MLNSVYQNTIGRLLERYDDRLARLGGYVTLKEIISVFGAIPILPWNEEKLEVTEGWLSKTRVYVYPGLYRVPMQALKEAAQDGQKIVRIRIDDLGYHALEIIREIQKLAERAKTEGIECILRQVEVKPDFSEVPT